MSAAAKMGSAVIPGTKLNASWSPVLMLSGFEYHAASRSLTAKPRINPRKFRCFWSTASGWVSFSHVQRPLCTSFDLTVQAGSLALRQIDLIAPAKVVTSSTLKVRGASVAHRRETQNETMRVIHNSEIVLNSADLLAISVSSAA